MTRLRRWRFGLTTAAATAGVLVTCALGIWQLSRAADKLALQAGIEASRGAPLLGNGDLADLRDARAAQHRPVRLRGRWIGPWTVYLDNRPMSGRVGFYVVTPLELEGSGAVVLVQRGWAPRNFVDRAVLPAIQTPAGAVQIEGRMALAPARLYELPGAGAPLQQQGFAVIRQNLDLGAFAAETRLPLTGFTVLQTGPASEGLQRDWPQPAAGVDKHYGYAFQWFGLAGLILVLYVWFQFIAARRHARRS